MFFLPRRMQTHTSLLQSIVHSPVRRRGIYFFLSCAHSQRILSFVCVVLAVGIFCSGCHVRRSYVDLERAVVVSDVAVSGVLDMLELHGAASVRIDAVRQNAELLFSRMREILEELKDVDSGQADHCE